MTYKKKGDCYDGEWSNDKKNGFGIMKYSSGDHFEGNWENDKRYGRGIYYQKEKEWYLEGEWQKDILEGIVVVKKK